MLLLILLDAILLATMTYAFRKENNGKGLWEPFCGVQVDGNNPYHLFLAALLGAMTAGSIITLIFVVAAMLLTYTGAVKDYNLMNGFAKIKAFFGKK